MLQKILSSILICIGGVSLYFGVYQNSLPYNELGNYFDGLASYQEQSAGVYIILGAIFIFSGILGYVLNSHKIPSPTPPSASSSHSHLPHE